MPRPNRHARGVSASQESVSLLHQRGVGTIQNGDSRKSPHLRLDQRGCCQWTRHPICATNTVCQLVVVSDTERVWDDRPSHRSTRNRSHTPSHSLSSNVRHPHRGTASRTITLRRKKRPRTHIHYRSIRLAPSLLGHLSRYRISFSPRPVLSQLILRIISASRLHRLIFPQLISLLPRNRHTRR